MKRTFDELASLVLGWANSKNLLVKGNEVNQIRKVEEEVQEIKEAIASGRTDHIRDEIGDGFVTLIILSYQVGMSPEECLSKAYDKIKNRTGKTVNGLFIKD